MVTTARDGAALTAEELRAFERIGEEALAKLSAAVTRPTRAPLPWAEKMFTVGVTGTNGKTSTTRSTCRAPPPSGVSSRGSFARGQRCAR